MGLTSVPEVSVHSAVSLLVVPHHGAWQFQYALRGNRQKWYGAGGCRSGPVRRTAALEATALFTTVRDEVHALYCAAKDADPKEEGRCKAIAVDCATRRQVSCPEANGRAPAICPPPPS